MKKIVFNCDQEVIDHAGEVVESFKDGQTYSLNEHSAERWIRRGFAVAEEDVAGIEEAEREAAPKKTSKKRAQKG